MSRFDDRPVGGDEQGRPNLVRASKALDRDRSRGALIGLAAHDTEGTHLAETLAWSLMCEGGFKAERVTAAYGDRARDVTAAVASSWAMTSSTVAAGNGSLARTTPIGLFYAGYPERLRRVAMADSAITHPDARCRLACAAFDAAIAGAAKGDAKTADDMLALARTTLGVAASELAALMPGDKTVADAEAALASDLDAATRDDPGLDTLRQKRFVRVAFRLAFWELVHAASFTAGMSDVISRGGDDDTRAIAGALLGARFGESAIPQAWRERAATDHTLRLMQLLPD